LLLKFTDFLPAAFKLLNEEGLEFEAFFTTSHVAAVVTGGYLA
jgi:hypothetical protein